MYMNLVVDELHVHVSLHVVLEYVNISGPSPDLHINEMYMWYVVHNLCELQGNGARARCVLSRICEGLRLTADSQRR